MSPSRSLDNLADVPALDSKGVRDFLMAGCSCERTNRSHHFIIQCGVVVAFSLLLSCGAHIGIILVGGSPIKICKAVVSRVGIPVATLHPFGTRAFKREQNETVNVLTSTRNDNYFPAVLVVCSRLERAPFGTHSPLAFPARPNGSVTASSVPRIVRNILIPSSHSSILSSKDRRSS